MEKLTIREASERFGLSRARLYQLLDKGIIAGHRSDKKGRGAESWIDAVTLKQHLKIRDILYSWVSCLLIIQTLRLVSLSVAQIANALRQSEMHDKIKVNFPLFITITPCAGIVIL
jgi:transposase